jgi:hypothetical protein
MNDFPFYRGAGISRAGTLEQAWIVRLRTNRYFRPLPAEYKRARRNALVRSRDNHGARPARAAA